MLKRGEADIAYAVTGELGEEVRRTPGLTLRPTPFVAPTGCVFADQWDPSSPWHDRRVRLAANHAVDRQAINQAVTLGFSKITGSIIPTSFDFYWQPPLYPYDPAKARQLLAEAGYPKGFDAGDFWCDASACRLRRGRSSTTFRPSASGRGFARSSGRGSSRRIRRRSSRTSSTG